MTTRRAALLTGLSAALAVFVFLKNAWVTEDAYIIFRSVEQLFAGHGPVWNPHERVQTFTSPLWFWMLAGVRLFTSDLYLGATALSLVLFLGTLVVLFQTLRNPWSFAAAVAFLVASTGFFDFTSSGLENGLAYFLLALFLKNFLSLSEGGDGASKGRAFRLLALAGLLVCVRHDLGLVIFPASLYVVKAHARLASRRAWLSAIGLALLPLLAWSAFSLLYYGFPFPNTAYAKLNTGIPRAALLLQGLECLCSSFANDSLTLPTILCAALLAFERGAKVGPRFLVCGIVLNLAYFMGAGGDFMQGRFLSYDYLIAVTVILRGLAEPTWRVDPRLLAGAVLLFGLVYRHTPLNSPLDYENPTIVGGVADERGFYFKALSLAAYVRQRRDGAPFPRNDWADEGRALAGRPGLVSVREQIGLYGYFGGLDRKIVDPLALSDPFLARLPVTGWWRVGHYRRALPEGYEESVRTGRARLADPQLNEYYRRLTRVTQSPELFSAARLRDIWRLNVGRGSVPSR